jgi:16S rRNA (cytosine967-C5)-methyltransferase
MSNKRRNGRPSTRKISAEKPAPRPPPRPRPRPEAPVQVGPRRPDDIKGGAPRPESTDARGGRDGRLGRIHDRILDVIMLLLERVPLDRALDQVFRRSRDLGGRERHEITELAYAFARTERRLDDLLLRGAKSLRRDLSLLDAPIRGRLLLLALHQDLGEPLTDIEALDEYAYRRVPGLFEAIAKGLPHPASRSAATRIGVDRSLPDSITERLVAAFGESRADEIGVALLGRAPFTVRVATQRTTRERALARIAEELGVASVPTRFAPQGLVLERRVALGQAAIFEEGWIEPQDEGSQLIACALGARPGEVVYDACAGAGGKTLALADAMGGHGRLMAFDREGGKLTELKKRARRAGLTNHEPKELDFVALPADLAGRADRVLVDAPCSGSGTFRRQPDARWRITETHLRDLPNRQVSLVQRAADAVRPGGLVLYATCSVLAEENEAVVKEALDRDRRLEVVSLAETLGPALASELGATYELRLGPGPGVAEPDGFYMALLRRV